MTRERCLQGSSLGAASRCRCNCDQRAGVLDGRKIFLARAAKARSHLAHDRDHPAARRGGAGADHRGEPVGGGGLYVAALIVVVILAGVTPIEEHYQERIRARPLRTVARSGEMSIDVLQQVSGERSSRIKQFVVRQSTSEGLDEVTVTLVRLSQRSVEAIAARLHAHPGIVSVETDIG